MFIVGSGTIFESLVDASYIIRYIQVGNAVAVPVAIALGYAFGQANQGLVDDNPLTTLPFKFPQCLARHQDLEL